VKGVKAGSLLQRAETKEIVAPSLMPKHVDDVEVEPKLIEKDRNTRPSSALPHQGAARQVRVCNQTSSEVTACSMDNTKESKCLEASAEHKPESGLAKECEEEAVIGIFLHGLRQGAFDDPEAAKKHEDAPGPAQPPDLAGSSGARAGPAGRGGEPHPTAESSPQGSVFRKPPCLGSVPPLPTRQQRSGFTDIQTWTADVVNSVAGNAAAESALAADLARLEVRGPSSHNFPRTVAYHTWVDWAAHDPRGADKLPPRRSAAPSSHKGDTAKPS